MNDPTTASRRRLRSPHDREIAALAAPALGALIAEPLYVLADTAVVGHLGTPQLAGLAVASSVLLTLYAVFIFLAYGTTAAVSRLLGAGDEREAAHQAVQSMWLALVIGIVVAVVGAALSGSLVTLMGADGAVRTNALVYLRISLVGVPAMLLVLAGTGYLRGLQDTRTPLAVALGTGLLNLALEVGLIYGLGLGIGASAASTVVAQTVAAAVYVQCLGRAARRHRATLAPHPASLASLARVGRDLLIRTAALRAALVVATAVATRLGDTDVAALSGVLPHLFTDDADVVALASFLLIWVAALQPVNAVAFVLDGVLIGAGDMRFLAWAMVGAAALFVPAAVAVAALDLGIGWLWASLGLLMVTRTVTLGARFAGGRWVVVGATR